MKYLKKFENTLEPDLKDCFDGIESEFSEFELYAKKSIINEEHTIRIRTKRPIFFELSEDMKDEIVSSIGKAGEIGYKLDKIILYNGNVSNNYYYSINQFENFKSNKGLNFRFDHLTAINIYFRNKKY